jgi:hypothetical protein
VASKVLIRVSLAASWLLAIRYQGGNFVVDIHFDARKRSVIRFFEYHYIVLDTQEPHLRGKGRGAVVDFCLICRKMGTSL